MRRFAVLPFLAALLSCGGSAPDAVPARPAHATLARVDLVEPSAPPVAHADEVALAPLDEPELVELAVPGFASAVVSIPRGATTRRPVIVAAHGTSDRPEDLCRALRKVVGDRGFVLCPRGTPVKGAPVVFEYESSPMLRREVLASLDALEKRYVDHVDPAGAVFAGFSLGSLLGVHLLAERGELFPRALLIEGGWDRWTNEHLRAYRDKGGMRVLFACGETVCPRESRGAATRLAANGIETDVVVGKGEGHRYGGRVGEAIRDGFDWLVDGDARWAR